MIKLLSLFSGIGAFEKALKNIGAEYELLGFSEVDKNAIKAYAAIHDVSPDKNLGDVTKINGYRFTDQVDLLTYGFPCQDISIAGHQKGLFDATGQPTRSGLFFDALDIIKKSKPNLAIAENVGALLSAKFANQFEAILEGLEEAGYNQYFKVLNAADYGIAQHRKRLFIISIKKEIDPFAACFITCSTEDLDFNVFPKGKNLTKRLKDYLENSPEPKYFIEYKKSKAIIDLIKNQSGLKEDLTKPLLLNNKENGKEPKLQDRVYSSEAVTPAITTSFLPFVTARIIQLGNINPPAKKFNNRTTGRVYDPKGFAPTLNTMAGGGAKSRLL